jgi:hypothetical protein
MAVMFAGRINSNKKDQQSCELVLLILVSLEEGNRTSFQKVSVEKYGTIDITQNISQQEKNNPALPYIHPHTRQARSF